MDNSKSMESLALDQIKSKSSESIKLDYEVYFKEACNYMNACENLHDDIINLDNSMITTMKIFKSKYAESVEDSKTTIEIKKSFGVRVKQFFAKIWAALVSLFQKIVMVVVNLVKSMIIYIQKKKLSTSTLAKICSTRMSKLKSENSDLELNKVVNALIKTKVTSFDQFKKREIAYFDDVHAAINNPNIKRFINDNKIFINNRKSIFNLKVLEEMLKYNVEEILTLRKIAVGSPDLDKVESMGNKLNELDADITALTNQAVLGAEVENSLKDRSYTGNIDSWIFTIYADLMAGHHVNDDELSLAENDSIKTVANVLTYGIPMPKVNLTKVPGTVFLQVKPEDAKFSRGILLSRIDQILQFYIQDYNLVCGPGGYIENLEKILKSYNELAKNDSKTIKTIKDYINAQLEAIEKSELQEQVLNKTEVKTDHKGNMINTNDVLRGHIRQFTKIMSKVNNVKTRFVGLRQYIIGDLITLLGMEERVLHIVAGTLKEKETDEAAEFNPEEENTSRGSYLDKLEEGDESLKENLQELGAKAEQKLENIGAKLADKIEETDKKLDNIGANVSEKVGGFVNKVLDKAEDLLVKDDDEEEEDDSYSYDNDYDDYSDENDY